MDVLKNYSPDALAGDSVTLLKRNWQPVTELLNRQVIRSTKPKLFISLGGPFRMWSENGKDIPMASEMSKRLLAILLRSRDMRRGRVSLLHLLWDEDKVDPRPNLRQLLKQTRDRLGAFGDHLLADHGSVALIGVEDRTERIENRQMAFFEDAGVGTEEFEEWFQVERANFDNLAPVIRSDEIVKRLLPRPIVALMPLSITSESHQARVLADWVSNDLRDGLVWNSFVDFVDLRAASPPVECDMEMRVSVTELAGGFEVAASGYVNGVCRWSQSVGLDNLAPTDARAKILEFSHKVGAIVEKTACRMTSMPGGNGRETILFDTITQLFATRRVDVETAIAQLDAFEDPERCAQILAFRCLGRIMRLSEYYFPDRAEEEAAAEALLMEAIQCDPHDLATLSVAALFYVHIKPNEAMARDFSDSALDLAPFSTLALHVRASLEIGFDRLDAAADYVALMRRVGRYGPLRHYAEANAVILAFVSGDWVRAVELGQSLLRWRPAFLPVARHVFFALLCLGRETAARELQANIRGREPEFATERMWSAGYPFPSTRCSQKMLAVLKGWAG